VRIISSFLIERRLSDVFLVYIRDCGMAGFFADCNVADSKYKAHYIAIKEVALQHFFNIFNDTIVS